MLAASWLSKKYIDLVSARLPKFRWIKPVIGTCRCVFCGDSKRNPNKTRGYIYERQGDWFFKCHNCGISASFSRLLKHVDPTLYREYVFESVKESGRTRPDFVFAPAPVSDPLPRHDLNRLPSIADLPDDHAAREYVANRCIPEDAWDRLWYTETWGSWLKSIDWNAKHQPDDGPRLVIPFLDPAHRRLVAAQARALFPCRPNNRYLTAKADDDVVKVFGRDRWTPSQPTWFCEGPLDSLFMPNALAAAGSDILSVAKQIAIDPPTTTIVFDNEPRNPHICKSMTRAINAGFKIVVWSTSVFHKDINDLAIQYPDSYQDMLSSWVYSGPRALLALATWRRDIAARSVRAHHT